MNYNKIPDTFYIYENSRYSDVHHKNRRKKYKVVNKEAFAPYYLLMKKVTTIRWSMIILVFIAAIVVGMMSISSVVMNPGVGLDKRTGIVADGQIKYIQNVVKYIDLKDAGINQHDVQDGDKVTMYFDHDNFVFAESNERNEVADIKMGIGMLSALLGGPVMIALLILWTGRFNIRDFDSGIYGYRKSGDKILLTPLCVPCRKDGSLMESRMEQRVLTSIKKHKRYRIGITRVDGSMMIPSTGKVQTRRLWILNDEAYYDDIINYGE